MYQSYLFFLWILVVITACSDKKEEVIKPITKNKTVVGVEQLTIGPSITNDSISIQITLCRADSMLDIRPDAATDKILRQAFSDSKKMNYKEGMVRACFSLGKYYTTQSLYERSILWFQAGLSVARQLPVTSGWTVRYYGNLAINSYRLKQYDTATFYLYKGLELAEHTPGIPAIIAADIYLDASRFWSQKNNKGKSLEFLSKAEDIVSVLHDTAKLLETINQRGAIHILTGTPNSALPYALKVLESKPASLNTRWFANYMVATIFIKTNKNREALPYLHEAMTICSHSNNRTNRNFTTSGLAAAYSNLGEYEKAEILFNDLLTSTGTATYRLNEVRLTLYQNLGITNTRLGRYEKAVRYYDTALRLRDSFYEEDNAKELSKKEALYQVFQKDKLLAAQQIRLARQKNWLIGAGSGGFILLGLSIALLKRKKHKEQMAQLKAVMKGEEQERERLARELHDGIGGMLAAIKMNISAMQQHPDDWQEIMQLVDDTAEDIRTTAHNLMPNALQQYALPEALRVYCEHINTGKNLQIDLQFHSTWPVQHAAFILSLYRVLQELIQNIVRHAHARQAVIQFRQQRGILHITIEDDGKGFTTDQTTIGLGLQNIRSRVAALRGRIEIESSPGRGTICYIELPLEKNKNNGR